MANIIRISLEKDIKDFFLLFWSIFLPFATLVSLAIFEVNVNENILVGLITMSTFFYCCTTNSFSIFAQRKRGVFDLLTITPFSLWKYLSSITISQTVIACTVSFLLLYSENSIFDLKISALQFVLFIPFFFIGSAIFTLMGFILSSFPKNEGQLSISSNLVMIPLFLCSSIFFKLGNSPMVVQWLSWINPVEWLQNGYRSILATNYADYLISVAVLLVFLVITLIISIKTFRMKET